MPIIAKIFRVALLVLTILNGNLLFSQSISKINPDKSQSTGLFFFNFDDEELARSKGLEAVRHLLQMKSEDELRLVSAETDRYGATHEQYQHFYGGLRIEDGMVTVHSRKGQITSINGEYYPVSENLSARPSLSAKAARERAKQVLKAKKYDDSLNSEEVVVFQGKLAWKMTIRSTDPHGSNTVIVDTESGNLLRNVSNIAHATGTADTKHSGTQSIETAQSGQQYVLHDSTRGPGIFTYDLHNSADVNNATDFFDNDNNWTSAEHDNVSKNIQGLDLHWSAEKTYDYWNTVHGRTSYDQNNSPMIAYAHYYNSYFGGGNAFYDYDKKATFYGGDNDPDLDVTSHEFGHGLSHSEGLLYLGEASSLHEGLSDLYSTCVSNYVNQLNILSQQKNIWLFGEEWIPYPRDFSMQRAYWDSDWSFQNDAPHSNGGVLRYWFYLLCNGGSGANFFGTAYNVQGITISQAELVLYEAVDHYLNANSTFPAFKQSTIEAVKIIYGLGSTQYQSVVAAWQAVAVPDYVTSYCVPAGSGNSWINLAKVVHQLPSLLISNGYGLSSTPVHDFLPGSTYPITLDGASDDPSAYLSWRVWIDFNKDGDFSDPSELAFQIDNSSQGSVSGYITIPSNIPSGPSRMRIAINDTPFSACDTGIGGAFLDYQVNFIPSIYATSDGYCVPWGSNDFSEIFSLMKFGPISNAYGYYTKAGYSVTYDTYKVWPGQEYTLTVRPKFMTGGPYPEHFTIWIDLNQNKNFESTEIILQGKTTKYIDSLTTKYTIPLNTLTGKTRIRVAMSRGAYSNDSCSPLEFGQVQDVVIDIQSPQLTSADGYCTPLGSCVNGLITPYNFKMDSVVVGQWKFKRPNYSNVAGYFDLTSFPINYQAGLLPVEAGKQYPLRLRPESPTGPVFWTIWLDYDHDKLFENNEVVFANSQAVSGLLQGNFAIDPASLSGQTRMRVAASFAYPYADPCQVVELGQIIDLLVDVSPATGGCLTPASLIVQNVTNNSAHIAWQASNATDYEVQFRKVGDIFWTSQTVTGAIDTDLVNLQPGTQYEVKVRSLCGSQYISSWKSTDFATNCPAPTNLQATNITYTSADLSWTDSFGPTGVVYKVEYSIPGQPVSTFNVNDKLSAPLSNLQLGTQYLVGLSRVCSVGQSYTYLYLTTICPVPDPVWVTDIAETSAKIHWVDPVSTNGVTYNVYYRKSNDVGYSTASASNTNFKTLQLQPAANYYAKVSRTCSSVESNTVSDVAFSTNCLSPTGFTVSNITTTDLDVQWMGSSGTIYHLEYANMIDPNIWTPVPFAGVDGLNQHHLTGLLPGETYSIRIKSECIDVNKFSPYVTAPTFHMICPPPVNVSIEDITETSADVTWINPAQIFNYNVYYKPAGGNYTVSPAASNVKALSPLAKATTYYVAMTTVCSFGVESAKAPQPDIQFATNCPIPGSLAATATPNSAHITWVDSYGATYLVEYRLTGGSWSNPTPVSNDYADLANLVSGSNYEVRITSQCDAGNKQSPSVTLGFLTQCPVPSSVSFSNITSNSARVNWTDPFYTMGATYSVYWRPKGKQGFFAYLPAPSNQLYFDLTSALLTNGNNPIPEGVEYEVKVSRDCSTGTVESGIYTFTTICPTPTGLSTEDMDFNEADYKWNASTGAQSYEFLQKVSTAPTWPITPDQTTTTKISETLSSGLTYYAKVRAACEDVPSTYSSAITLTAPTYCASKGSSTTYEYIDFVGLLGMSRTSASDNGYFYYSSQVPNLTAGVPFSLQYSAFINYPSPRVEQWRAWIDFNHDGDFTDAGEEVMASSSTSSSILSQNITIPTSAESGLTRMRISLKALFTQISCESFTYGEVEDYLVNITGGSNQSARIATRQQSTSEEKIIEEDVAEYVYPNPVETLLYLDKVSGFDNGELSIKNEAGKVVQSSPFNSLVDVSNLPSGIYFISLRSIKVTKTFRFVKK